MKEVKGPKTYGRKKQEGGNSMKYIDAPKQFLAAKNEVYDLTSLIPEMMEKEGLSRDFCENYFMTHLNGVEYKTFPEGTPVLEIADWITNYDVSSENIDEESSEQSLLERWEDVIHIMGFLEWEPEQAFEALMLFQEIVMDEVDEEDVEGPEDILNVACENFRKERKVGLQ